MRARIRQLNDLLAHLSPPPQPPRAPGIDLAAASSLRLQLDELQAADTHLSARLTAIHPARVSLRRQWARLEERLQQLALAEATHRTAFDPVRRNFELALKSAEAHQATLESQAAELAAQQAELVRKIAALEVSQTEQPQPGLEPSASESGSVDSPEVCAPQFRVWQAATKSERPIAPQPSVWLATGLCLATLGSIAAVALAERRNPCRRFALRDRT